MGIKLLKERFNILHTVQREDNLILIGSSYVSDLIKILPDMSVHWGNMGASCNDDLSRNFKDMTAAIETGELAKILKKPDKYSKLLTVWKSEEGKIYRKYCEEYGWPHITTDGELMYNNTFFKSRKAALKDCREGALYMVTSTNWMWRELISQFKRFFKWEFIKYRNFIRAFLFFGL